MMIGYGRYGFRDCDCGRPGLAGVGLGSRRGVIAVGGGYLSV